MRPLLDLVDEAVVFGLAKDTDATPRDFRRQRDRWLAAYGRPVGQRIVLDLDREGVLDGEAFWMWLWRGVEANAVARIDRGLGNRNMGTSY